MKEKTEKIISRKLKASIFLMLLMFSITLFLGNVSAGLCYQETANISSDCGGLNTGSYSFSGNNFTNRSYLIDGLYSTSTNCHNALSNAECNLHINYSFPILGSSTGNQWCLSNNITGSVENNCTVIPNDCVSRGNVSIILKQKEQPETCEIYAYCFDGEFSYIQFFNLTNYLGGDCGLYSDKAQMIEEYIYWNKSIINFNSQSYNSLSYSGILENFMINIIYDSSAYNIASANLIYNGTSYSSRLTTAGDNTIFSSNVTMPIVSNPISNDFYWRIALTNSSGVNYFNSTNYTQTISPIKIQLCNSTFNVSFVNFSIKDSEIPSKSLNATFKATFDYLGYIYSFEDLTETNNSFAFCFSPAHLNYTIDADIEYDSTGYATNHYYLKDYSLSNTTTNIPLYLLNSSKSTITQLLVRDKTQAPQENVIIQIQRYDVGTDTYYTVAMAKTDFNGQDLAYLNWYDTFYKYTLTRNNEVLLFTNVSKIYESPVKFDLVDTTTYSYEKFEDITYSLTFNNITENFILTYSIPSGDVTAACLRVVKRTAKNDTEICNTCESSSSATVYCNIAGYGNGTYVAQFYATGSLGYIDSLVEFVGAVNQIYDDIGNIDGSIYAFLFAGVTLVMFLISPVFAVIGALLGVLGAMALGFQPMNYMEFFGIAIVGVIVIIILKR